MSQENVTVIRPKLNFVEVLQKYGYPIISKTVSNGIENARTTPNGSRARRIRGEYTLRDGGRSQYDLSKWAPLMDLPIKISDRCCQAMKKGPMHIYERATKRHPITGTTAAESLIKIATVYINAGEKGRRGKTRARLLNIAKELT